MTTAANPFTRPDTLTGTCQAIGEDFGINPLWLRVGFAVALFWSAAWVIGAYLVLACVVLVSRLAFPARRAKADTAVAVVPAGANDEMGAALAEAA
jgi:phage shock protein C